MDDLLESGIPNYESVDQLSPELIAAVVDNDVAKLQSFREAGASLSAVDKEGNTLLQQAIHHKKAEVFDYLLTLEDAPLNLYYASASPILATFHYATEDFALKLIERGCRLDDIDMEDSTLLHYAVSNGWIQVAEKLIEKGADVNSCNERGETPLFLACLDRLVDEVFLLLFHGAKPCIKNYWRDSCLDMLAKHDDEKVQDFFLNTLYPRHRILNLATMVYIMEKGSPTFPKLLDNTAKVAVVTRDSLQLLAQGITEFNPEHFRLFIYKFARIVERLIQKLSVVVFFLRIPQCNLQKYVDNLYIIFNHHKLCPQIVEKIKEENFPVVQSLLPTFKRHGGKSELLTELVCCLLSRGVHLYHDELYDVFTTYGYCELFKIMLHMDIKDDIHVYKPIVPAIIYDVNMTIEQYLRKPPDTKTIKRLWKLHKYDDYSTLCTLLDYFALPELKKYCMRLHNAKLTARVLQLPAVPSLVELARNAARAFIISKYETTNSRQFYTVLESMPIAKVHKQTIAFEKKLYF